jgi:PilZ domain
MLPGLSRHHYIAKVFLGIQHRHFGRQWPVTDLIPVQRAPHAVQFSCPLRSPRGEATGRKFATMNPPPVRVERRAGQRFPFLLPVFVRDVSSGVEARGFTQDISSRGVFFFTDAAFAEGAAIELTLNMPSEITLGDNMRVRCRGSILRVALPPDLSQHDPSQQPAVQINARAETKAETKIGVAVRLHGYEYLPEIADSSSSFQRVSALHEHRHEPEEDQPAAAAVGLLAR